MQLTNNVKITFDASINDLSERVYLNSGVEFGNNTYLPNTYRPKRDWKVLENSELTAILVNQEDKPNFENTIAIVPLSVELIILCNKLGFSDALNRDDLNNRIPKKKKDLLIFTNTLNTYINQYIVEEGLSKFHGLFILPFGEETVAKNQEGFYMGLHIDNAFGVLLSDDTIRSNRISLNLGKSDRFLFVINKTVSEIAELVTKASGISDIEDEKTLCNLFFQYYSNYPVMKVRIKPNEAYIAPTDNLIHDGSTLDMSEQDITLVFSGYFNVYKNEL
jgi:hypothetical protein